MNKACFIYQPWGLGDILFLQKFAAIYRDKGFDIYWPIIPEFKWLNNYITDINFIILDKDYSLYFKDKNNLKSINILSDNFVFFDGFHLVPQSAKVMAHKYESVGLSYSDWSSFVRIKRNKEKENYLFKEYFKLSENKPYIFVNRNYKMKPAVLISDKVCIPNNLPIVEMKFIDGFSVFDWCKIIENAKEIHMIETSLNYVMESPNVKPFLKADVFELYSRHASFSEVDYLFSIPWRYRV